MDEAQIDLVKPKGFAIDFLSIGAPVAVRAEGDEVIVLVRMATRPRDYVVNIDLDMSACRDGAPMSCLDQHATPKVSRYWRTDILV